MKDNVFRKEIAKGILSAMFYDLYNFCRKHMPIDEIRPKTRKEELFEKFMREVSACYKMERSVWKFFSLTEHSIEQKDIAYVYALPIQMLCRDFVLTKSRLPPGVRIL